MIPGLTVFQTTADLASAVAQYILALLARALAQRGRATLVLSGGQTPQVVYRAIVEQSIASHCQWGNVHLFWGDERCVPPDDPSSNFRMARETLLNFIAIPESNVHRIKAENPPEEAATEYSSEIRKLMNVTGGALPVFDLILLGVGEDGHVASIFPGSSAETEAEKLVTSTYVDKLRVQRITMTLPVLNNAREICVLVAGSAKAEILRTMESGMSPSLPVHRIKPVGGGIRWFVDRDAAAALNERRPG